MFYLTKKGKCSRALLFRAQPEAEQAHSIGPTEMVRLIQNSVSQQRLPTASPNWVEVG